MHAIGVRRLPVALVCAWRRRGREKDAKRRLSSRPRRIQGDAGVGTHQLAVDQLKLVAIIPVACAAVADLPPLVDLLTRTDEGAVRNG